MRINKYVALATGMSRRHADLVIDSGRIKVNGLAPMTGQDIQEGDSVMLDGTAINSETQLITIMMNKPKGFVCSRDGQGSQTIYDLLPPDLHKLKPIGRLDKDSSGLLLMSNNGELAQKLTHPSFQKQKVYKVRLGKSLQPADAKRIKAGVQLTDGPSALKLDGENKEWTVTMSEGRNRQIRRTFSALGYEILELYRTQFGPYVLGQVQSGKFTELIV